MIGSIFKTLVNFITKEFFLTFVYLIVAGIMAMILWCLFAYVFPNKALLQQLINELYHSKKLVLIFFYVLSLACIYLFRTLMSSVQSTVLK